MGKKTILVVILAALVCSSALAASDIGFKGAYLHLAYVKPEDPVTSTIGFGGGVDLGTLAENISLDVGILYWSKSYDVGVASWKYSDLAIKVHGKYHFKAKTVDPYVGAGLGVHMYSFKWNYPAGYYYFGGQSFSDTSTRFGIHFLGGVAYPINEKISIFGELEYDIADVNQFIIGVGASMKFGK